jgi:hypothetical protein
VSAGPDAAAGHDAALGLLAERVAQLGERVGELTARVETTEAGLRGQAVTLAEAAGLARDVERLAETLAARDGTDGQAAPGAHPRIWAAMDDEQSADALRDLARWVAQIVLRRYPHAGEVLPPCWPAHPCAVEELDWLYWSWVEWATAGTAARSRDAADWHDRWLPGVLARLGPHLAGCVTSGQHVRPEYRRPVPAGLKDPRYAPEQLFVEQMRRAGRASPPV